MGAMRQRWANAEEEARGRLRQLKQSSSVKEFTTLLLEVPHTSDRYALFLFMDGLQNWAMELKRRGVQEDLATAIATAEGFVDYSTNKNTSKSKEKKPNSGKSRGDHAKGNKGNKDSASYKPKDEGKDKQEHDASKPRVKCFICDWPHQARECPKKKVLNSIVVSKLSQEGGNKGDVGALVEA